MIPEVLWGASLNRLFDAGASSRLTFGRAQASLALRSLNRLFDAGASSKFALGRARINSALLSLTHLLPRILVANWAVLELLAAEGDLLEVLLAVCPVLLVVYTVATCTFQLLHG